MNTHVIVTSTFLSFYSESTSCMGFYIGFPSIAPCDDKILDSMEKIQYYRSAKQYRSLRNSHAQ